MPLAFIPSLKDENGARWRLRRCTGTEEVFGDVDLRKLEEARAQARRGEGVSWVICAS